MVVEAGAGAIVAVSDSKSTIRFEFGVEVSTSGGRTGVGIGTGMGAGMGAGIGAGMAVSGSRAMIGCIVAI
jgi:hypothetical protein